MPARGSSLRRRWKRAFAAMLALSLTGAAVSTLVVTRLVGESHATAEEVQREVELTMRLRRALAIEEGLAHAVLDSGATIERFLASDQNVRVLLDEAAVEFSEPAEQKVLADVGRRWNAMFSPFRPGEDGTIAVPIGGDRIEVVPLHEELGAGMAELGQSMDELAATYLEPISDQLHGHKRAERQLLILLYGLVTMSVVVTVALARRARRDILVPIQRLSDATRHVAGGEFGHRIALERTDEFGDLATTFNTMAAAIETDRRELEEQLYGTARLAAIVDSSDQAIIGLSPRLVITSWNPGAERLYGYSAEEALGRSIGFLMPAGRSLSSSVLHRVATGERISGYETDVRVKDGRIVPISVAASPIIDATGDLVGISSIAEDISRRKALEARLYHQAFHDPLTGLANRSLLKDRLRHALARQARTGGRLGMVLLDLDDFKSINDSLGHRAGDELLVSVADRLRFCVREADTLARLGGDEFAVLLEDLSHPGEAVQVAERIIEALSSPFTYEGRAFPVSASVGISLAEGGSSGLDDVIRDADVAMYLTKSSAKGAYTIFEPGMHLAVQQRLQVKAGLAKALGSDELSIHYQPIVDVATGDIVGVEALARWQHPELGMVPPGEFIAVAEQSGLIVPLGLWVLENACREVKRWQEQVGAPAALRVSVNVSGRQLEDADFVDHVARVLEASRFDPGRVILEVTETVLVTSSDESTEQLRRLKALGVQLAIDDFGTGYSSLSSLQRLPVDILKVDRSFVTRLEGDDDQALLARTVLGLGRTLQLETVAEGVETSRQVEELRRLGCDLAQGYFFGGPADAGQVAGLLGQNHREATAALISPPG